MALSGIQMKMVRRLLQTGTEANIAHAIEKIHPSDLTILFSELTPLETQRLIDCLFLVQKAGQTLSELPEFLIPTVLDSIEDKKLASILSRLEPDDCLFLLEKVPERRWNILLDMLPRAQRLRLDKLLLYSKNSAGSVMTSNFSIVNMNMTVEEAIASLRQQPEAKGVFYVYVVDDANRLVGVQSLRQLVLATSSTLVKEIMNQNVYSVNATAHQEEAAQLVTQYNLLAIPVVSDQHELLGVITVDDVIDIVKEAATEDIYNLAGLSGDDRATTPLFTKIKKRLPWMLLNLLTAALAASVVSLFEASIHKVVALAVFMPIVAGMGGNTAAQSLTVITRSIALGELSFIKTYKAILKEMANGLVMGLITGFIAGCVGYWFEGNFYLGLVLTMAMILNLAIGGLMGALVPVTFKSLKLDPAVGSSVLVTAFTDTLGFLIFLGLATLMMTYLH